MKRIAVLATLLSLVSVDAHAAPPYGSPPPEATYDPSTAGSVGFESTAGYQGPTESAGANTRIVDGEEVAGLDDGYADVAGYLQEEGLTGGGIPEYHVVQNGDTLWAICDQYFRDPYLWPKVWSYNPGVTNAHWIFPGDRVRLRTEMEIRPASGFDVGQVKRRNVEEEVLDLGVLSRYAFIDDEQLDKDMQVAGAAQAKVMMGQYDTIYLDYDASNPPVPGERLAIYKPQRKIHDIRINKKGKKKKGDSIGYLVEIVGEVQVTKVAEKTAEAYVPSSLRPIERGMRAGELRPIFTRATPVAADITETGLVVYTLEDLTLGGENQMVVVNFGASRGLKRGHVLDIVAKGDAYSTSHTLDTPYDDGHPRRVYARGIVLESQKDSALVMVFDSSREVVNGDHVEIRARGGQGSASTRGNGGPNASGSASAKSGDGKAEAEASFSFGG
jgi:hypothetical protein